MNLRLALALAAIAFSTLVVAPAGAEQLTTVGQRYHSTNIPPGERMIAGKERGVPLVRTAAVDEINVPVTLATQVRDETQRFGPVGVISGTVRGSIKGAFLALRGGARALIGGLDVLTTPMGGLD